ncbi:vitronectin-like [Neosynchiropus ocellatus]
MRLSVVLLFVLIAETSAAEGEDPGTFTAPRQLVDDEPQQLRQPQPRPRNSLQMTKPVKLLDAIIQSLPLPQDDLGRLADPLTSNTNSTTRAPPAPAKTTAGSTTTASPDPDADPCSGRPFDAFTQLSNSSIYAFRGEYVFELGQRSVLPGYPKLIEDVWGIPGPIDAAFTRFNCQGKTYIFKGSQYWRFNKKSVLEKGYPRGISAGFDRIVYPFDAAFTIPAAGHHAKEKFFLFKAEQYASYEFVHRPRPDQCHTTSDDDLEDLLSEAVPDFPQGRTKYRFIERDWKGLKSPVDAALTGRILQGPRSAGSDYQSDPPYEEFGQQSGQRRGGSSYEMGSDVGEEVTDDTDQDVGSRIQAAYIFREAKYYRVDLSSKRVEPAVPPYPRSIAKYWLGCPDQS